MSLMRLPAMVRFVLMAGFAGLALLAAPVLAQTDTSAPADPAAAQAATDLNSIVATVGGENITEADIAFAAEDLGQDLANIPTNQRRAFLVAVLIDMKVMAQAARAAKLDQTDIFQKRLTYLEDRSLRRAYFTDKIAGAVTEEAIKAAYDTVVAGFTPEDEVRARHILVSTEDDAKAVKAEIEAGKPFELAALEKSQDGTANNGGDLGYFTHDMMVKPFADTAFALEVGQISDPVETQYGWHIIKLEDKRKSAPPPLDQVRAQLQQQVMIDAFNAEMALLKKDMAVTFTDPALEAAVNAENQAVQQSEDEAAVPTGQ